MPSKSDKIAVELATKVVGKWNDSYQWIPTFGAFATIAMAFSVGANNLPAPFSTSIGSGALTLLKASIMACAIYIPGAASASNSRTVDALFSDFLKESQPTEGFLMWSMVVVLLTTTMWLTLATYLELPVSSQQSIHAAMLGTMLVTQGFDYLPLWNKNENHDFNSGLLWIFLEWTLAPSIACLCAWFLFVVLKSSILRRENAKKRILVFLPIDYGISAGLLCFVIVSQVIGNYVDVNKLTVMIAVAGSPLIGAVLSLVVVVPLAIKKLATTKNHRNSMENNTSMKQESVESRGNQGCSNVVKLCYYPIDFMQMRVFETVYEEEERSCGSLDVIQEPEQVQPGDNTSTEKSTPFKQLLKSTPNRLVQTQNFQRIEKTTTIKNFIIVYRRYGEVLEYDRRTLVRHALAENFDDIEDCFGFPQLLASCMIACYAGLFQSTTEIASIMNPYVAILDMFEHRSKYSSEDVVSYLVVWWYGGIGGLVAAIRFLLCGGRLTQCLGGKLTYMSNSRGWASQLATVAAMIIVAKVKLPVLSVQAFIGSLVGVEVADDRWNVN
ncbi:hypothetical protein J1N35_039242 [Gossypium stocksii]|uniref:Phosphate transporter n=1 Tax=Gossypium stocksii TaxID=47602 RepID=A0A9D3UNM5_9ROSI|nr:hypothetical protein J1N35_039242 [Gossypium stocksii]